MMPHDRERLVGESAASGIRVLHVDDEPDFAELTADFLEQKHDGFTVTTETDANRALDRLDTTEFDCIVSDYNMPSMNGLEFLEVVREEFPDRPFILFTGKGSEEIAADAISAGVTEYLQKETGTDQYTVLANRIQNAVSQHRTEQQYEETRAWYQTILQHSSDYVMIADGNGTVQYVTPPIERVMGYEPKEIIGAGSFDFVHEDDIADAMDTLSEIATQPDREQTVEFRAQHDDGSWRWLEVRGRNFLDHPVIEGVLVNVRDITQRKERERELERQKIRLEDLTSFLSHDLQNQLNLLNGRLDMATTDHESEQLTKASETATRMAEMIDSFAELAEKGQIPRSTEPVEIETIVGDCWNRLRTEDGVLDVEESLVVEGDPDQLQSLFENLLLNAIEHAGPTVTIRIGTLDETDGFYVEDDGRGISEGTQETPHFFEPGYTTTEEGRGFGLAFVKHIAEAHGWTVELTNSETGGMRFEFSGTTEDSLS